MSGRKPSVSFYTMGCNVNVAETEKLRARFAQSGFGIVEGDGADVIIINSCSVTSVADKGARQLLRRLRDKNGGAIIALIGCAGEMLSEGGARKIPEADIVMGNEKFGIVERVKTLAAERGMAGAGINAACFQTKPSNNQAETQHFQTVSFHGQPEPAHGHILSASGRPIPVGDRSQSAYINSARAYIQIQNGCDCFCSYCVVPRLRGKPVSTPLTDIILELNEKAAAGCKEAVLSGVNLALYGEGGHKLADVLQAAERISGIERIRLSSLEPGAVTDDFLDALPGLKKLCPHFHIPLQSGCDEMLKAMKRGYTIAEFMHMLDKLRGVIPDVSVTTDVIIGFPGESEEHFRQSMRGVIRCMFDDIHIFKYSLREGTAAASMPNHVTEHKKTARAAMLQGVKQQARYSFLHRLVSRRESVLFLNRLPSGRWEGATPQGADVSAASEENLLNSIMQVFIDDVTESGNGLLGRILPE